MSNIGPYLTAKREQYEALRASIKDMQLRAVEQKRDLSEDELRSITAAAEDATVLVKEIEQLNELQLRDQKVAELAATIQSGEGVTTVGHTGQDEPSEFTRAVAGTLVPTRTQVDVLYRAARDGKPTRVEHRAAVDTTDTGKPSVGVSRGPRTVRRLAQDARLPTVGVAGVVSTVYPIFGAGSAQITAEGIAKTEYSAIAPGAVTPQVIAVWTDVTMQVLTSMPTFEAALMNRHLQLVARREDELLVTTVSATIGTQEYTAPAGQTAADSLLVAASLVLDSGVAQMADLAVINPADVARIFGGATGPNGETPESAMRLSLHGMTCYPSSAVPVGRAIVGAWADAAALVIGQTPVTKVDPYSGMKTNITTLLTEEAVGLAIMDPVAFVETTFATA